ncbi:TPA: dUTP diphosphatase, partial [Enterococcus faecium]
MRKRGFEVISKYKDQNINLPQRATHHAAGYDFEAAEEVVIPSIWKAGW